MASSRSRDFDDVEVIVSGGLLADPDFTLQKLEDDGSLSVWVGFVDDDHPILSACDAGPIPNAQIRVSRSSVLVEAGFELKFSRADFAADPDRHMDVIPPTIDKAAVIAFIACFDLPIPNPRSPS